MLLYKMGHYFLDTQYVHHIFSEKYQRNIGTCINIDLYWHSGFELLSGHFFLYLK